MSINELMQWWNLVYTIPLVVSLVWIVATILSGAHMGGSHGHDAGHEGLGHMAHHVGDAVNHAIHHADASHGHAHTGDAPGHDGHAHEGHSHHGEHHAHGGASNRESLGDKLSAVLGIGQIPVTLMIGLFLLCWGAFGIVANQFFAGTLKYPAVYILPSLGATFVVSSLFTRFLSAILGRVMPGEETFGVTRLDMVGSLGKAVYPIGESAGTVNIKDSYGTLHRVQAKIEPGSAPIETGAEVIVVDFDEEDKRFLVRISNL